MTSKHRKMQISIYNCSMVNIKPRYIFKNIPFKETVFVISSEPFFRNGHSLYTTVPCKPLSYQQWGDILVFLAWKLFDSENFLQCFCSRNSQDAFIQTPNLKMIIFYCIYSRSDFSCYRCESDMPLFNSTFKNFNTSKWFLMRD